MLEKIHDPVFTKIDLDIDVNARTARFIVPGVVEARGEPIVNPVNETQAGGERRGRGAPDRRRGDRRSLDPARRPSGRRVSF
jgi:hypothetical protein